MFFCIFHNQQSCHYKPKLLKSVTVPVIVPIFKLSVSKALNLNPSTEITKDNFSLIQKNSVQTVYRLLQKILLHPSDEGTTVQLSLLSKFSWNMLQNLCLFVFHLKFSDSFANKKAKYGQGVQSVLFVLKKTIRIPDKTRRSTQASFIVQVCISANI